MNAVYEKLNEESEKWLSIWLNKKIEGDHMFPVNHIEYIKLAFKAGFNSGVRMSPRNK